MNPPSHPAAPSAPLPKLFQAALDIPDPAARAAFLSSACGSDSRTRRRLEELLEEHQRMGDFLNRPAQEVPSAALPATNGSPARHQARPPAEQPGDRIGRYKLLEQIGEGGCGSVYMAEQEEPVRRRVALKVIKAGMDTKAVIARFEAERQALALMDHPNIARVLDAGTTDSGRPYFVMELVRGIRITDYCDHNSLTTRERLDLFVKVCQAIQHAHQKGIIHRDIKPSNILVTLHDGVPVPKVIDFGIAKAIGQRLTELTVFTAFEQFIGTPAYMSPEQAEMSGLDIDTRTDIYSLGMLLYEILTGRTPFDGKELVASGLDAMRRTIRETDPERPSTLLRTLSMAEATELVRHRREKVALLVRGIRGDLDWIVMKAVSKDRARRYESASALARDIERFLHGQAITARPPSAAYLAGKFVRRNKLLVAAGTSMLIVLILATAISGWLAFRATRAERDRHYLLRLAEAARQREVIQRERAELERTAALRRAYNSDMNLVPQALLANNYGRVLDLLDRHRANAASRPAGSREQPERDFRQWEWRYYWNQARSEAAFTLPRQPHSVTTLAISPDGRYLVTEDRSGTLKLWDLFRRAEISPLRLERGRSGPFVFSGAGDRLAAVVDEGPSRTLVRVWGLAGDKSTRQIALDRRLAALAFSAGDEQLLLLGDDQSIRAWDFNAPPLLLAPGSEEGRRFSRLLNAAFSRDGKLAAVNRGGQLRILEVATGREKCSLVAFERGTASLAFSPGGDQLAAGPLFTEVETAIKLFDTSTGEEIGRFHGHASWVPGLSFNADGTRLISAGADQTVRMWDVSQRRELAAFRGHRSEVNCASISADGKTIVSGCKDGTIYGWAAEQSGQRKPFEILPSSVAGLEFMPDSQALLTVHKEGYVELWDLATGRLLEDLPALGHDAGRLLVAPDGTRIYASSRNGSIIVLDWPSRSVLTNLANPLGPRSPLYPVAVTDHGRTLITVGFDSAVRLWDTTSWTSTVLSQPHQRPGPPIFRTRPVISSDHRFLVVPGAERAAGILDLRSGKTLATLDLEKWGSGSGLAFSPDNALLAVASREGTVDLWDLAAQRPVDVLRGHLLGVHDVAFSPDGERLASASAKNEAVKLWDVDSRHEVATLSGEGSLFEHVRFSPDGTVLVALNTQGQLHLWRAPSLESIQAMEQTRP